MQALLDYVADRLAMDELQRNRRPIKLTSFVSLLLLFAPGVFFLGALLLLKDLHPDYTWFNDLSRFPWQFWGIILFGLIATTGGAGDWLFHKVYVTVGPNEHHSHLLALGAGGIVFLLMLGASVDTQPARWLVPMMVALLMTVTLICYDEFAFHLRRCKPFETMLHRLLVFGNGAAFLCWVHWVFVARMSYAGA
jgi:hypothetical protein